MLSYKIATDYPVGLIPELVICLRKRGFQAYQESAESTNFIVTDASRAALILLSGFGWVIENN
jgi:hypothetical protein